MKIEMGQVSSMKQHSRYRTFEMATPQISVEKVISDLHQHLVNVNPLEELNLGYMQIKSGAYTSIYIEHFSDELIRKFITDGARVNDQTRKTVKTLMFGVSYARLLANGNKSFIRRSFAPAQAVVSREPTGGELYEPEILRFLNTTKKFQVFKCKILVNKYIPFICCNPDGLIVNNDVIQYLLEIKSIRNIPNFKYLDRPPIYTDKDGRLHLHPGSKTYSQIQLSLLICGLEKCLLVVFLPDAKFDNLKKMVVWKDLKFLKSKMYKIIRSFQRIALPILDRKKCRLDGKKIFDEE